MVHKDAQVWHLKHYSNLMASKLLSDLSGKCIFVADHW